MTGPQTFDWTVIDDALAGAKQGNMHVVLRIFVHYPDQPLRVPLWLINQGIQLRTIQSGEKSPQYDDPKLLAAFETFIKALGAKYDGHNDLAFLQLGLLGKWGEWHTYPDEGLLSDATKDAVVGWYKESFKVTPLQVRNPWKSAYEAGMGLHDDSFGFSTLDGPSNGGQEQTWFFWPEVKAAGQEDFWRKSVMGGETRPEIQGEIFESGYQAGTPNKQDFFTCVDVTHATYMFHHNAFVNGQALTGNELETTLDAHVELGYNYLVSKVAAKANARLRRHLVFLPGDRRKLHTGILVGNHRSVAQILEIYYRGVGSSGPQQTQSTNSCRKSKTIHCSLPKKHEFL